MKLKNSIHNIFHFNQLYKLHASLFFQIILFEIKQREIQAFNLSLPPIVIYDRLSLLHHSIICWHIILVLTRIKNVYCEYYHHGFRVASERVLQQSGEFGVPVGYVGALAVHQSTYDISQSGKGEVDLSGLLQPISSRTCLRLTLRSLTKITSSQSIELIYRGINK